MKHGSTRPFIHLFIFQGHQEKHNCAMCGKSYSSHHFLMDHTRAVHLGQKYLCNFENCGKEFNFRSNLRIHEKRHLNIFIYRCQYCQKGFNHKVHFEYHINCHENQRNFKCTKCDKAFNNKKNQVRHTKYCGIPRTLGRALRIVETPEVKRDLN